MKRIILYFLFLMCFGLSCISYDPTLLICNKSEHGIYIEYSCDSVLTSINLIREGYWFDSRLNDSVYVTSTEYIQSDSAKYILKCQKNQWINFVNNCTDSTMYIYIIADSVAKKYTNNQILANKMFLERLKLTKQELERSNWTVTYTGVSR